MSIYTMCQATKFWKVEQQSQIPYLLYTNLHGGDRVSQFGTCSGPPGGPFQSPSPAIYTNMTIYMYIYMCRIYIYDHLYVEVALGQNCQMYNKLAAQGGVLPYNLSSNEWVNGQ